ncbi:MAG: hypothetical protein AAGE52_26695 [Myxococcota bacterium]
MRKRGSVDPTSGKFRVRFTINGQKETIGTFDTFEQAERIRAAFAEQLSSGRYITPEKDSFIDFGKEWMARRELSGEVRGIKKEKSVWRRHVLSAPFADMSLDGIRPMHIEEWLDQLRHKPAVSAITTKRGTIYRPTGRTLGRQSIRHAYRLGRQCFDAAIRSDIILSNPASVVKCPRARPA